MYISKSDEREKFFVKKYAGQLWILSGLIFMLPSLLGNFRGSLVALGSSFILIGLASLRKRNAKQE